MSPEMSKFMLAALVVVGLGLLLGFGTGVLGR